MRAPKSSLRLPPMPAMRDLLKLYNLRAMRQLSQNFLMEERLINKIVKAAGRIKGGFVCEVGPGPGGITRSILQKNPQKVLVIEKDRRFIPILEQLADASDGKLHIMIGDVMTFNMEKMFPEEYKKDWFDEPPNIHLIGNLPFNVSTPLIIRWLEAVSEKKNAWAFGRVSMTLTFQKEVAERMVAPVLGAQRSRLSIMCQNWCEVRHVFTINGSAFLPKPEVDVGVVHFKPKVRPVISLPFKIVEKVVRCIFNYRQKYCVKGASNLFPPSTRMELANKMLVDAEIDPTTRPMQLTLDDFRRICESYVQLCAGDQRLLRYNVADRDTYESEQLEEEELEGRETIIVKTVLDSEETAVVRDLQ